VIVFEKVARSTKTELNGRRVTRVIMDAKLPDNVPDELVLGWDLEAPVSAVPKVNAFEVRDGFEPEIHIGKADGTNPLRWERVAWIKRDSDVLQLEMSNDQASNADRLLAFLDNHFVAVADKSGKVLYRCQFRPVQEKVVEDLGAQNAVQLQPSGHSNANVAWWFEGSGVKARPTDSGIAFDWSSGQVPGNDGSHDFEVKWAGWKQVSFDFAETRELVRRNVKTKQDEADRLNQTIEGSREELKNIKGDEKNTREELNKKIKLAEEAKQAAERDRDLWQGWLNAMDTVKLIVIEFQNENGVVLERVELRGPAYKPADSK
jgi:hypothetical protein